MRFSFTDEQLALRDGAREVLEGTCTPADVRAIFDSGDVTLGRSAERWRALEELGATSLLASEAVGGLGFSDVELVGVIEEAGKVVLPEPLGVHAGVAIPVLSLGEPTACELLASLIEDGDIVSVGGIDVALSGPVVTWFEGRATAERVPSIHRATRFLLASANEAGVVVSLVGAGDVEITPTPSLDPTRDLGTVSWTPTAENMFANGAEAIVVIDDIASRLALYQAAEIVGLVDAMLAMTATYTMDRQQFGAAIGSFQAVKHLLADVRVGLEFARPAVYRAAWSMANDDDAKHHDAALAKALASQLALDAAATCLQVHGGIGYTWEHDLQFAMKRCWALARTAGDAATQRARALSMGLELS
jgi:alkylation response protein AidB-like acyl-CoA dehydrogenase